MSNYPEFKESILRTWQGDPPTDDEIKRIYFESLSRQNRRNYDEKLKKKIDDFKALSVDGKIIYVVKEILIWAISVIVGGAIMVGIVKLVT